VKPEFTTLNGHDPVAFILPSNIARRYMTKGQQAMAVAMVYPYGKHARMAVRTKQAVCLIILAPTLVGCLGGVIFVIVLYLGIAAISRDLTEALANIPAIYRNISIIAVIFCTLMGLGLGVQQARVFLSKIRI
jgi:hypothetical protein